MADTTALKNRIRAAIKANSNQEITGPVLQQTLLDIVDELNLNPELQEAINTEKNARQTADTRLGNLVTGIKNNIDNGYVYAGIAAPSTVPVSGKVFYIATAAGTYTNFGGQVLTQGINILRYNGTAWSSQQIIGIDDEPTAESDNLVKSGGIASMYGSYVENPEFIEAKLDAEGKILEATKKDGTKVLGSIDINGINYKVVSNPEFVEAKLDAEGKILWAIKADGTIYYGAGVPTQVIDYINEKIAELSLDEYEDIVAFLADLEKGDETLKDLLDKKVDGEYVENPEFIEAKLDAKGKILEATEKDGTKVFGGDVKVLGSINISGINYKVVSNPEWLKAIVDSENKIICGIKADGTFCVVDIDFLDSSNKIKEVLNHFDVIDNPEFVEVKLDAKGKILEATEKDGTKVFGGDVKVLGSINISGIETNHLELTEKGMNDFQQALKDAGFTPGGGGDWSDREVIELPEPKHYSLLNVEVGNLPINNSDVSEGYIEYYDGLGNYFKMICELVVQGQTSRIFARTGGKGNYTLDLPKEVKFGSWVPQDSFHLKGCAKDITRGYLATSYKWAYKMLEYLDAKPNRVLLKDNKITTLSASGDNFTDWGDGARCLSDGFPIEVYLNGEYWGLYALQLKKHRKNYSMKKSDYTSFFLDPDNFMSPSTGDGFWRNDIWWARIEIRNPKDLVCMDGTAYDGDNPKELIDSTSEFWNPDNAKHVGSANTKQIIQSWPGKYQEVKDLINNSDIEGAKNLFNQYFDYNACMLVYIFNCLNNNADSIGKNTLWATYKNGKISPMLWDLDGMYGEGWIGNIAGGPNAGLWAGLYANAEWPLSLFWRLYETEIKAVYSELRDNKIISVETWHDVVFNQWVNRIGEEAYKRDIEKWDETPSYRKNYTNTDYWEELGFNYYNSSIPEWDENTNYSTNDIVCIKESHSDQYMRYKAKASSTGVCPVTKFYNRFPSLGGYYNSPKRMQKWITRQIELCDSVMEYNS